MILQLLDKRVKKSVQQEDATVETHIAPSLGIFVHGLEDEFEAVRLATLGKECFDKILVILLTHEEAMMQITRGASDSSIFLEEVIELIIGKCLFLSNIFK